MRTELARVVTDRLVSSGKHEILALVRRVCFSLSLLEGCNRHHLIFSKANRRSSETSRRHMDPNQLGEQRGACKDTQRSAHCFVLLHCASGSRKRQPEEAH